MATSAPRTLISSKSPTIRTKPSASSSTTNATSARRPPCPRRLREMRPLIQEIQTAHTPESLVEKFRNSERGVRNVILLRTSQFDSSSARYSFVVANPFLTFRSFGSRCELHSPDSRLRTLNSELQFGDPWHLLDSLMSRFEILDEIDLPFPLGGCFGFWGYDLKNF